MNVILFIDPGKTTGWSLWNDDLGSPIDAGQVEGLDNLVKFLKLTEAAHNVVKIIWEAYRIFPKDGNRRAGFSPEERKGHEITLKVVGALTCFCVLYEIEHETQELSAREAGYAQGGIRRATSHQNSHERDALAHGVNYYVRRGKYKVKRHSLEKLKRMSGED